MGSWLSNFFWQKDESLEQFVRVSFTIRQPVVEMDIKPKITASHVAAMIFRWYRFVGDDPSYKFSEDGKDMPVIKDLVLVSRSARYKPVEYDGGYHLLFHIKMMNNSIFQECFHMFPKTLPKPTDPVTRKYVMNEESINLKSLLSNSKTTKIYSKFINVCFNLNGEVFGPIKDMDLEDEMGLEIDEGLPTKKDDEKGKEEKGDEEFTENELRVVKLYPRSPPRNFNFLYRRLVIIKELLSLNPDILCLQSIHKEEFKKICQSLAKNRFGTQMILHTSPNKSSKTVVNKYEHFGLCTSHNKDVLEKIHSFKVFFEKIKSWNAETTNISPETFKLVTKICEFRKIDIKTLDLQDRAGLYIEYDFKNRDKNDSSLLVCNSQFVRETETKDHLQTIQIIQGVIFLYGILGILESMKTKGGKIAVIVNVDIGNDFNSDVYKMFVSGKLPSKYLPEDEKEVVVHELGLVSSFRDVMSREPVYSISDEKLTKKNGTCFSFFTKTHFFDSTKVGSEPEVKSFPGVGYASCNVAVCTEFCCEDMKQSEKKAKREDNLISSDTGEGTSDLSFSDDDN